MKWPLKMLLTWGLMVLSIVLVPLFFKLGDRPGGPIFLHFFLWLVTLIPAVLQFTLHFKLTPRKIESFLIFAIINVVLTLLLGVISFYIFSWYLWAG